MNPPFAMSKYASREALDKDKAAYYEQLAKTLALNADNPDLTDAQFRQVVRNSIPEFAAKTPHIVIDADQSLWEQIKEAAGESAWMPPQYVMNDWVADVCRFLREGTTPRKDMKAVEVDAARFDLLLALWYAGNVTLSQEEDGGYGISLEGVEVADAFWTGDTPEAALAATGLLTAAIADPLAESVPAALAAALRDWSGAEPSQSRLAREVDAWRTSVPGSVRANRLAEGLVRAAEKVRAMYPNDGFADHIVQSLLADAAIPDEAAPGGTVPADGIVVETNRGRAYRQNGCWFAWHNGLGSRVAIREQDSVTEWRYIEPPMREAETVALEG